VLRKEPLPRQGWSHHHLAPPRLLMRHPHLAPPLLPTAGEGRTEGGGEGRQGGGGPTW
jgi:hypothetical protein